MDTVKSIAAPPRRRGLLGSALSEMREDPLTLITVLLAVNALNLLDYTFTVQALGDGNVEANPLMRALFQMDYSVAGAVKLVVIALVSVLVWRSRDADAVLLAALTSFGIYAVLFVYHVWGSANGYL